MCDTLDMNTHLPKPVKEEKEPEKAAEQQPKNAEEDKKEEDKEKVGLLRFARLNNLMIVGLSRHGHSRPSVVVCL